MTLLSIICCKHYLEMQAVCTQVFLCWKIWSVPLTYSNKTAWRTSLLCSCRFSHDTHKKWLGVISKAPRTIMPSWWAVCQLQTKAGSDLLSGCLRTCPYWLLALRLMQDLSLNMTLFHLWPQFTLLQHHTKSELHSVACIK